jgi:hypothetical protein
MLGFGSVKSALLPISTRQVFIGAEFGPTFVTGQISSITMDAWHDLRSALVIGPQIPGCNAATSVVYRYVRRVPTIYSEARFCSEDCFVRL